MNAAISTSKSSRDQLECMNPATGKLIDTIPVATPDDARRAIANAKVAFGNWSTLSFDRRARYLARARDILLDRQREVIDLVMAETGKPRMDSFFVEIAVICDQIEYYISQGEAFLKDKPVTPRLMKNKRLRVEHRPRGVVLNISPWNYPLDLAWSPLIPALLAGNTVINKPSEFTPLISLKFHEILMEAGVPEGVAQVVVGHGDVGAALCRGGVDYVIMTGSTATGKKVAHACAEQLIPYTLELGGKDAAIVLEDADLERAANGIVWAAFFNSGQTCISTERCYVVDEVYEDFVARVVRNVQGLRQGIDRGFDIDIGAMVSGPQVDIVEAHVQDAIAKGATLRTGGQRNPDFPDGQFFEPTVLTEVDHTMTIMTEETFGPVLPIMRVRDEAQAVALANDSPYGLNGSIWCGNIKRARAVARHVESGNLCINDCLANYACPEVPFGGIKESGIGSKNGRAGMIKYCREVTVMEDRTKLKREPFWFPYSGAMGDAIVKIVTARYRSGLGRKLKSLVK